MSSDPESAATTASAAYSEALSHLKAAQDANDEAGQGSACAAIGEIFRKEGKLGSAAAQFEVAAEYFRSVGDVTKESEALLHLESLYRGLDEVSAADAIAERREFLSNQKGSPKEVQKPAKFFSHMMSIFNGGMRELREVEDHKRLLRMLVFQTCTNDGDYANEIYTQRRLMQVGFENLPFKEVENRVTKFGPMCLDRIEERTARVHTGIREFMYILLQQQQSQIETMHPEGLTGWFKTWEVILEEWGERSETIAKQVKDEVISPLSSMRKSYVTLCEHFISQRHHAAKKVSSAQKRLASEQEKGKRDEKNACKRAKHVLEARKGALEVVQRRTCKELQLIEHTRLEITIGLMKRLMKAQKELTKAWSKAAAAVEKSLNLVASDADIRTFCNRTMISAVIAGNLSPDTLVSKNESFEQTTTRDEDPPVFQFLESLETGAAASEKLVSDLCESFERRSIRQEFLLALNRLRASKTKLASIDHLMLLMIAFLDACYIQGDIRAAKMVLILAETFFEEDSETGKRTYVQDGIRDHGIWKSNPFWEETFYMALREEIFKNVTDSSKEDSSAHRPRELTQANFGHIAYAQLASSSFSMVSLNLPQKQVDEFLFHGSRAAELSASQHKDLLRSINE